MKIAPKNRVQRTLVAGAAALILLASTGCGAINEQATTKSYSASDGIVASVGPDQAAQPDDCRRGARSYGRLLGTCHEHLGFPRAAEPVRRLRAPPLSPFPPTARSASKTRRTRPRWTVPAPPRARWPTSPSGSTTDPPNVRVPVLDGSLAEVQQLRSLSPRSRPDRRRRRGSPAPSAEPQPPP